MQIVAVTETNRTLQRPFVELGDSNYSGESQLKDRWMSSTDIDRRISAIVAHLSSQIDALIQSINSLVKGAPLLPPRRTTFSKNQSVRVHAPTFTPWIDRFKEFEKCKHYVTIDLNEFQHAHILQNLDGAYQQTSHWLFLSYIPNVVSINVQNKQVI